jgi:hypothetical protein
MGEGGIKGGAVNCLDTPEQQAGNKPATAMLRGPRGEPAMPKGRTKAKAPTLHASIAKGSQPTMAETEGGDNMVRDDRGRRQTTTIEDER